MSEKPILVEVQVYDSEGAIAIHGVQDVFRLYQAMKAISDELPGNCIPFIKLGEA